ncbi:MAG: protease complex subunit PrcB family protein [Thermodesulfobacteriota bacterium]
MKHHRFIRTFIIKMLAMVAMSMALLFTCGMGQRGGVPAPELHVDILLTGTQGDGSHPEPSAEWIASREELGQLVDVHKSGQLPAQDRAAALDIDFNTTRILLVRMGQKPTAGYSLKLDPESCSISQKIAHISLIWAEPAPDLVTAQVITSPFILLKLSKGGYDAVEVVDQHGQARFDLLVAD